MSAARAVRFAAVLVVLAGYLFVFRTGEARIAAQIGANTEVAGRLLSARRILVSRAALEAERARLTAALRSETSDAARDTPVAAFLHDAASLAAARRTRITTVTSSGASSVSSGNTPSLNAVPPANAATPVSAATNGTPAATPSTSSFRTTAFELGIEGRYADVLATVRALSAASRGLASVEIGSLARARTALAGSTLSASLKVALHRLATPAPGAATDVPARPE